MTDKACDYALTDRQVDAIAGAALLPVEFRRSLLRRLSKADLVEAFAQFIGLANSVVANNREMIELTGIISGELHPHSAHEINLPTIFGALQGVKLANGIDPSRACGGCAYRQGTPANQSPVTTADTEWQKANAAEFWCHEEMNEDGTPKRRCIGHMLALKQAADDTPRNRCVRPEATEPAPPIPPLNA